jgi:hypothetical protein
MSVLPCSTFKTLEVSFTEPSIPPANGYVVKWRVVGQTNWNTVTQNQNPITIAGVPACFNIEGTIQADCGGGNLGNAIIFSVTGSTEVCYTFQLLNTGIYTYVPCGQSSPVNVNNLSSAPQTVCAIDGSVTGGSFTRSTQCNV